MQYRCLCSITLKYQYVVMKSKATPWTQGPTQPTELYRAVLMQSHFTKKKSRCLRLKHSRLLLRGWLRTYTNTSLPTNFLVLINSSSNLDQPIRGAVASRIKTGHPAERPNVWPSWFTCLVCLYIYQCLLKKKKKKRNALSYIKTPAIWKSCSTSCSTSTSTRLSWLVQD